MKTATIISELIDAAERMGMEVRVEKGNFKGGRCQVGNQAVIMLNKRHPEEVRLAVLARSLRDAPLDTIYLKPAVRDVLHDAWRDADPDSPLPASTELPDTDAS